jgi:hypothetical protein
VHLDVRRPARGFAQALALLGVTVPPALRDDGP